MEHPTGDQEPVAAERSHVVECVEHAGSTEQRGADECNEGLVPNADMPNATSGGTMGVMLGVGTDNDDPTAERDVPKAIAIEEELEIEEISRAPKEIVQLQCIHMARKRHGEWVFHEEDHFDRAMRKLQCTVDDLMSQIKVKMPQALSCANETFVLL
jgi:signal recognition particle subunit SEC65